MRKLIRELRRREVFRTAGLYVGGAWIVLQVADVILPAYEAPGWVFRALIGLAIVGLPLVIALAWMFDLTADGVRPEASDTGAPPVPFGRRTDFVVIAVLLVALAGSLYVNFMPRDAVPEGPIDPVSILIADFDNGTGDAIFDSVLEQGLMIGIEESPFVTVFDRGSAERVLNELGEGSILDRRSAALVSAREGIGFVLSGRLSESAPGQYDVSVDLVDPLDGETLASFVERADGKPEVLRAVADLTNDLRRELGDVNADSLSEGVETFTTISLEAMHDYAMAQRLARDGRDDEAIALYQAAVNEDPNFGRAWSGLGVSADKLGYTDVAETAWAKAMQLLGSMTERERYRTEGVYYIVVSPNSQKAIDTYRTLVSKYPADDSGHNNLALAYFLDLQFEKALEAGRRVIDIYPSKALYWANFSLYAMYASDFNTARQAADRTLELNPNYHKAYLPHAAGALVEGNVAAAREAFWRMADTGDRGASLANTGLADIALWSGDWSSPEALLREGIALDQDVGNTRAVATKTMMLAYAAALADRPAAEVAARIEEALTASSRMAERLEAALLYIRIGDHEKARGIANHFSTQLGSVQRAYGRMIEAILLAEGGEPIPAIDRMHEALDLADVWLVRYHLGRLYLAFGRHTEALSEFSTCRNRLGEAFSLFLNDVPTYRYTADLDLLSRQAEEAMSAANIRRSR
ncbi:MAG: tetratricopeptide repeat protein [Pseudomonadota bacterium]